MGARFGLRVSGITAALACALLVACGGGGGGGGGTPATLPPATPTPVPTAQSASGALSTSATTVLSLGGVAATSGGPAVVTSANLTMPSVNVASTGTVTMTATLPTSPSGIVAPTLRKVQMRPMTSLCSTSCTITSLAYFSLSVSPTTSITRSPVVTVTIPSNVTIGSGNAYLLAYVGGTWQEVAGPVAASNSLTFASAPVNPSPFTLAAGTTYVFDVVTTGTASIPTPTPQPTAAAPVAGSDATLPPVEVPATFRSGKAYGPYDVAKGLNFLVQDGYNGTGKTVAIIGDDPPLMSDLQQYITQFNIPFNLAANYSVVTMPTASPAPDSGGQDEATLDVETVMGLAPGAKIVFYNTQGDLSNPGFLTTETAVKNAAPSFDVFSISFGGCEQYPLPPGGTGGAVPSDAAVFAAMNSAGTAVTVSSGDEGDNCTVSATQNAFGVNYPGSDPSVIGVGGNESNPQSVATLATDLVNPVAWNDNASLSGQGATGGGVSTTFTLPSYQAGFGASSSMRDVPDIAMPAEGVAVMRGGTLQEFLGTSWSAPEAAAMFAELDEYCGGRPANPVAALYYAYSQNHSTFIDVTGGNNMWIATDNNVVHYSAGTGYDNTTGLGMPLGYGMATTCTRGGGSWQAGRMAFASAMQNESLGAARDTVLPFAARFTNRDDLGERTASETTGALVVMRRTSSMAQDAQTVMATLRNAGFVVREAATDGSLISISAPASMIGSYFRTTIHNVSQGRYGVKYSNATAMTLPASIAPYVGMVMADNLVARRPLLRRVR